MALGSVAAAAKEVVEARTAARAGTAGRARARAKHLAAVHVRAHARAKGAVTVATLLPARALKAGRTDATKLDILKWNLVEEARARIGRGRAVGAARGRIGQEQTLASARDGDVGQAALLLELARVIAAAKVVHMREDALLHAGHEDRRELQALGGVNGHHGDGMRLAGERVQVGAQSQPLHERRQRFAGERSISALNLVSMHGTGRQLRRRGIGIARDGSSQSILWRQRRGGQAIERIGARSVASTDECLKRRRGRRRAWLRCGRAHHDGLGLSASGHIGNASRTQLFQALERTLDILVRLLKFGRNAQEFLDVLGAALGLHRALGTEGLQQARLVDNHLDDVLELAVHATALAHQCHKARQAVTHLGAKHARLGRRNLAGLEERAAVVARKLLNLLDRGGADTAARRVDDTLDAHLVGRVHNHLEVGHDVADLGAVEESRAAHNLVGYARAQEHIFENTRLGVGAVEHSDVVVARALGVQLFDLAGNPAALVALVARLEGLDLLAVALGRE